MRRRQAGLSWHIVEDDLIVLDLEGSVYLKLNGSGRVLWEHLAEPTTDSELTSALVQQYGIGEERAAADVATFLVALGDRGLLDR